MMLFKSAEIVLALTALVVCVYQVWVRYSYTIWCSYGDLNKAGNPATEKIPGCAVVVGASITGILTARICADHYEKVLLIDAEECTIDPTIKRRRVKQHDQLHIFLGLMYPVLSKLFPSFQQEMEEAGGTAIPPQPVVYRGGGVVKVPVTESEWDVRQLYISREVLEALLRRLLLSNHHNVQVQTGTVNQVEVYEKSVKSVHVQNSNGDVCTVPCSLVLDATGTATGSTKWLKKAGFPVPEKQSYDPAIVYTCFTFQMSDKMIERYEKVRPPYSWAKTGHIGACFTADHHSVFMKIDNNRVRTMYQTYVGRGGVPENLEDLLAFTRMGQYSQWQKDAVAILCGEGAEEPVEHTRTKVTVGQCYRVVYKADQMPGNLFPMGDAALRVNPIFGQGCTKAVVDILTLDRTLRHFGKSAGSSEAALEYFLRLHYARTDSFWRDTRLQDYACEDTKPMNGETLETGLVYRSFLKWIVRAAHRDEDIGRILTETMGALRPSTTYFDPLFLARCMYAHGFK